MKNLSLFLTIFLGLPIVIQAQDVYYAIPNGVGTGTQVFPASLTDGLALLGDSDTLFIAIGTYTMKLA